MANLFGKLTTTGLEESQDRLGGFSPLATGIYIATIKALYAGAAQSGAVNVTLLADIAGKEYRETVYVTNKSGENFFLNKNDKLKKVPLPGFTVIDDICLIASGEPLANQVTEEKVINVYNFEQKKELPQAVQMLMQCVGQKVALGILEVLENKQEKKGDEYVAIADTRVVNTIEKVFHPELKITVAEARNGKDGDSKDKFWDAWEKKNSGQTRDKRTIKEGQGGSTAGGPPKSAPAAGNTPAPRKSLFSK
jgi:hypothetical protein